MARQDAQRLRADWANRLSLDLKRVIVSLSLPLPLPSVDATEQTAEPEIDWDRAQLEAHLAAEFPVVNLLGMIGREGNEYGILRARRVGY